MQACWQLQQVIPVVQIAKSSLKRLLPPGQLVLRRQSGSPYL
eukprot:CAMPEP_0171095184 /NCGR_PEP_ID=MMETSP0766_2-20121228/43032_1 /TAXON_ID=439317 /ORGANISM="Gambierdiscus australes, Strain CAWD 149" /LENGTH=41 /DNA_ID= /DNA_START= /DNA_END= /DNA_ORIENTATION=